MKCRGFLFDLDGTLINSLPAVERAWSQWGKKRGIAAERILSFIHGKQAITSLRHFMAGASEEEIQQEFFLLEQTESADTQDITAMAGSISLLTTLNQLNIPWAIVTSGSMPVASARRVAAGIPEPDIFITAESVPKGKPEPDPYLLGAKMLGLIPEECVVVEDAPAGILSGLAAGCRVIAVNAPTNTPRLAETDMQLSSLQQLAVDKSSEHSVILNYTP